MQWARCAIYMREIRNSRKTLVTQLEGKKPLRGPIGWENILKMALTGMQCDDIKCY
jgi:hypothetical protein